MDQNFQTSFIPKKPIIKESAISSRPVGILFIASLFILFTVLLATGGLFFYKGVVKKSIADKEKTLNLAKERFEPSKITELQVLDKRLRASSEILEKHIAITPVFEALEQLTMKTVRFTKFSYELSEDNAAINVKMSGQAIGYRSVALQSDLFAKNKNLIDPIFSNLTLDNSGNVLFDLEFSVDPSFVNYKRTLQAES
ncbi:MAG: hypothetical protein UV76_C0002G0111 [Candidatus Nomurabacteria bacterium GW2011_GWA2_43_15]|uniref:Fimbrial assembly family protein n=2 Tax=Candidatus Nomuraibacteriota TaxID=1752729 RepID=A0A0G1DUD4_9BACT|nr:MAG: hypothetical protein UV76_C0002G0111 [Candidatus Nomurabacteria bacterium GW2011_GWA2_43_15]KKT19847.1 MAG: hypothetical protein UW02_C0004G0024 [Candidatus Nomurabacteria bacterium GW2011_GWB1_43_7]